jgi:hypothetical protein
MGNEIKSIIVQCCRVNGWHGVEFPDVHFGVVLLWCARRTAPSGDQLLEQRDHLAYSVRMLGVQIILFPWVRLHVIELNQRVGGVGGSAI